MFQSARIKLTIWYVIIITVITVFFSVAAYRGFIFELDRGLGRNRIFIDRPQNSDRHPPTLLRQNNQKIISEAHSRIVYRIIIIDAVVIFLSGILGYFLAGRTLGPIKKMVDEQNRFITDASHELRTPLTAARTSLEVGLRDKNLKIPDALNLLKSNLEEIIHLEYLTNNLLRLAHSQNHKASNIFAVLDLPTLIEKARQKVAALARKKNISVLINVPSFQIYGDRDSLTELFVILLDNAIKYSPENTIVKITAAKKDRKAAIQVIDQGFGIAKKDLDNIFERFYRSDKSRAKSKTPGYGLGLSIAKKIIEEHNGTIEVKSKEKKGTEFNIELPMKKA